MTAAVPEELLTRATRHRIRACGSPIRFLRESGEVVDSKFCCGSSWCKYCARVKRFRVADCIEDKIGGGCVMVTLTLPAEENDLSEAALHRAMNRKRAVWKLVGDKLRWTRYHEKRGELALAASNVPPPSRPDPHPWYASKWDSERGYWEADATKWGCVWACEVTTGKPSKNKRRRRARGHWHVHLHVLVPSRVWAEKLNAAWQLACVELGHTWGQSGWTKTHFSERKFGAAEYLSKCLAYYTSKGSSLDGVHSRHLGAFVRGMHNVRRWDAQGVWRPLGIGAREERPDPAIGVLPWNERGSDEELVVPVAEFFAGRMGFKGFTEPDKLTAYQLHEVERLRVRMFLAIQESAAGVPPPS